MTGAGPSRPMLVIADDLTGACDTAGAVTRWVGPVPVQIGGDIDALVWAVGGMRAIDLDSRAAPSAGAVEATVAALLAAVRHEHDVYLKVDSTLRGHVLATVASAVGAFRAGRPGGRTIVCPAFPGRGRIVRDGRVIADGAVVDSTALLELAVLPGVEVCDATSDADLAAIVAGAAGDDVLWVGSAGLAPHVVAARGEGWARSGSVAGLEGSRGTGTGRVLVVVGSDQAPSIEAAAGLRRRADPGVRVLVGDPREASFVAEAAALWEAGEALVVTGGFTARRLMERAGIATLVVQGEVEAGMPWAIAPGRPGPIVTKAGGFGDSGSLGRAVDFLLARA